MKISLASAALWCEKRSVRSQFSDWSQRSQFCPLRPSFPRTPLWRVANLSGLFIARESSLNELAIQTWRAPAELNQNFTSGAALLAVLGKQRGGLPNSFREHSEPISEARLPGRSLIRHESRQFTTRSVAGSCWQRSITNTQNRRPAGPVADGTRRQSPVHEFPVNEALAHSYAKAGQTPAQDGADDGCSSHQTHNKP